jgi:hypothetical protein
LPLAFITGTQVADGFAAACHGFIMSVAIQTGLPVGNIASTNPLTDFSGVRTAMVAEANPTGGEVSVGSARTGTWMLKSIDWASVRFSIRQAQPAIGVALGDWAEAGRIAAKQISSAPVKNL